MSRPFVWDGRDSPEQTREFHNYGATDVTGSIHQVGQEEWEHQRRRLHGTPLRHVHCCERHSGDMTQWIT